MAKKQKCSTITKPKYRTIKHHLLQFAIAQLLDKKTYRKPTPEYSAAPPKKTSSINQNFIHFPRLKFQFPQLKKKLPSFNLSKNLSQASIFELINSYANSYKIVFSKYPLQLILAMLISTAVLTGAAMTYENIFRDLPTPDLLTEIDPAVTSRIEDRNGKILYRIYEDENRTLIPIEEMPPQIIYSTIAIEDKDFFNHHGFSIRGILRAAIANSKGEVIEQGGSTLTQQLVKNRLLTPERTFTRKIRELLVAIQAEQRYSKEEILEMYLNQVAYGGSTYGIEEAAQRFFGKSAIELSLGEAAMLAGLPAAPSAYSPYGASPELAFKRQEEVLRRMQEDGYITAEQVEKARNQPLSFRKDVIDIQAPHFVMYVKKVIAEKYGEEVLQNGGLIVKTSLDLNLQNRSQQIVTDEVNRLERLRVQNGAALITNPNTGEVLAMVGSKDYFEFENDGQVNVALRERQPGSSIKPLTYALALENGFTPMTTIEDAPVTYTFRGGPSYSPKNYDGKYHGRVTVREALASSYNIPAVKTLNTLGVDALLDKAEEVGITTWDDRKRYGLSLTLGGGEILMTEMATMYGAFANGGKRVDLNPILEVTNYKGEVLYRNECALDGTGCPGTTVINPGVAYLITNMLSDNKARTPAFGPMSTLHIPGQEVAVKTGTTNNLRDNWTFGYTSDRVVSVWVGNNDNTSMSYVASGITGASPIWNSLMRLQLSDENPHAFEAPESVVASKICTYTNKVSCSWCRSTRDEVFLRGTEPRDNCSFPFGPDSVANATREAIPIRRSAR